MQVFNSFKSYDTKVLPPTPEAIEQAARLLIDGEVVAIPTETVYGLACNAKNPLAVAKIFRAKGRPQDNPLIVHISDMKMLGELVTSVSPTAKALAEHFWPGPLTMIFEKTPLVPYEVSGGLETVAIRMPNHKVAISIIRASGLPLAAPSANLSGKPSPTTAQHVFDDLNGKIPAIIDGGQCEYGVESTVVAVGGDTVRLLRPGAITVDDLKQVVSSVEVDDGVLAPLDENEQVPSPGMKYQHYSPNARVVIVDADIDAFLEYTTQYLQEHLDERIFGLVFDMDLDKVQNKLPCLSYGDTSLNQANQLFERLRELDKLGAQTVFARSPNQDGIGLAVYNRLLRAAGFEVVTVEK